MRTPRGIILVCALKKLCCVSFAVVDYSPLLLSSAANCSVFGRVLVAGFIVLVLDQVSRSSADTDTRRRETMPNVARDPSIASLAMKRLFDLDLRRPPVFRADARRLNPGLPFRAAPARALASYLASICHCLHPLHFILRLDTCVRESRLTHSASMLIVVV